MNAERALEILAANLKGTDSTLDGQMLSVAVAQVYATLALADSVRALDGTVEDRLSEIRNRLAR